MYLYCIFTVDQEEDGSTTIRYQKRLHLFREEAFAESKKIGKNACVMEMNCQETWNYERILEQEKEDAED